MRPVILATLVATSLLAAGCVQQPTIEPDPETPTPEGAAAALPPTIQDEQQVTGSADPLNAAGQAPCASPSSQCWRYPFTLNDTANLDAHLQWTVPANDFDLYLFQGGEPAEVDGRPAPGTEEGLALQLEPGDYELVVVAWGVSRDTFHVMGEFSAV